MDPSAKKILLRRFWFIALALGVVAGASLVLRSASTPLSSQSQIPQAVSTATASSAVQAATTAKTSQAVQAGSVPVIQNAASIQPAAPDGKDLDSIRKWAHNELEVQRMLKENDKIYRRQLVVLKETVASGVERNRLSGDSIHQLTLPGLDGQEIAFEVKRADIEPSGLRGMFHGIVAGRPDSMVTLAFKNRTQAFTILSPRDNLYLDVEPHDPGDVIVKSIDLEKYGAGLCGVK
jgi:hypothetical protein